MNAAIQTELAQLKLLQEAGGNPASEGSVSFQPDTITSCLICITARSGSTLLADLMKKTGQLGNPDEYLNPRGPMQMHLAQQRGASIEQYMENIMKTTCAGGVFSMKSSYNDFHILIKHKSVRRLFTSPKFVFLTRKDTVLQAVSLYLAKSSQYWHNITGNQTRTGTVPPYDFNGILDAHTTLVMEQVSWEQFFDIYEIEPLRISYEDIEASQSNVLSRVAHFTLGKNCKNMPSSTVSKIGGDINDAYATRFRAEYTS